MTLEGKAVALGLLTSVLSMHPAVAADPPVSVSEVVVTASKMVEELTVTARIKCLEPEKDAERAQRPQIVSNFPEKGAVVRLGLLIVRVTFNQPMACNGLFLTDPPLQNPCPGSQQNMLLSYDRRTVRTVCVVEPNSHYGLLTNRDLNGKVFTGLSGLPAESHELNFTTSAEAPLTTVCDALVEDAVGARQIQTQRKLNCRDASPSGG